MGQVPDPAGKRPEANPSNSLCRATSGSLAVRSGILLLRLSGALQGLVGAGPRAAEPVDRLATGSSPPLPAFAVPDKRRGLLIPASCSLLKPAPDLVWA